MIKTTIPSYEEILKRMSKCDKPNYSLWLTYEQWRLQDFAALLVDVEPDDMIELEKKRIDGKPPFDLSSLRYGHPCIKNALLKLKEYQKILKRLERSKLFQNPEGLASPKECVQWAIKSKLQMPFELSSAVEKQTDVEDINKKELAIKLRSATKSLNTVLKAFATLCKSKFKLYEPATIEKIRTCLANEGFEIDDQTLRNHLQSGQELLSKAQP